MANEKRSLLLPVFLTVLIDMLGIGIIIPVLPALFFEESSEFFATAISQDRRAIIYGFLLASFPVMQFFGAPILGALSDRYGRKPMLMLSLAGTMIGYFLFAFALLNGTLWLLFFSRMLPGFTGGNISIIYSAIADISKGAERTRYFGLVGMAFGLGFIMGPALGGLLADEQVVPWFNAATPFWFTTILTLINIILVATLFRETLKERSSSKISFFKGFSNIAYSFRMPNLRLVFTVALLLSLGFAFFTQFFAVVLIERFSFTEKDIGLFFAWVGVWMVITQGVLVGKIAKAYAPAKVMRVSMLSLSISIALITIPYNYWWLVALAPLISLSQGINQPNLLSTISEQAADNQKGAILGINQSMQSLGAAIPPIIGGYLTTINYILPLVVASGVIFVAWLVFILAFKKNSHYRQ